MQGKLAKEAKKLTDATQRHLRRSRAIAMLGFELESASCGHAILRLDARAQHKQLKRALDDPEHLKTLAQLDQVYWYKSSEDYARWAAETFAAERATIERVGLLAK